MTFSASTLSSCCCSSWSSCHVCRYSVLLLLGRGCMLMRVRMLLCTGMVMDAWAAKRRVFVLARNGLYLPVAASGFSHILSYPPISSHIISYHLIPCHIVSYHLRSSHTIPYQHTSSHIISHEGLLQLILNPVFNPVSCNGRGNFR